MSAGAWRVDAHHHLWDLALRPQEWIDPEAMAPLARTFTMADLRPELAAAGVGATVWVQASASQEETAEYLALAAEEPLIAGVVGWVDLTAPDVADRIAALRAGKGGERLVGIRHLVQSEPDPGWLDRPEVRRGLRAVAAAGLAYDLLTRPPQLPAAVRAARELPQLRFVLDHLSKPPVATGDAGEWEAALRGLAASPNTFCKLSGLVTEAGEGPWREADFARYADAALDAFGPGRVMFGSDWPVCLLAASYAEVAGLAGRLTGHLAPAEREAVWAGTARRAYGLHLPAGAGEFPAS
ncbi:amidohydrolase family protein [Streptomyces hoynatensis]|uniref:Amidohydrolase n=1 Tax=Streptomyces hoynatensis TaxID=1141874 RepID=A0A3A9Z7C5_9ACTN|nr:amidohydrolase family protein [Streptomyces hoynatensis]RKN43939.1 amidohydrolase [Streptomyces hoynatensis]